ncbi:hypothetical protein M8818_003323 [Zalaria obscura]|uniref:Uncharacterized protein n=1 Tax=Zalaria obscura TaxID=2024903 RepID=A0ACC3SET8_9PEZI
MRARAEDLAGMFVCTYYASTDHGRLVTTPIRRKNMNSSQMKHMRPHVDAERPVASCTIAGKSARLSQPDRAALLAFRGLPDSLRSLILLLETDTHPI